MQYPWTEKFTSRSRNAPRVDARRQRSIAAAEKTLVLFRDRVVSEKRSRDT